MVIAGKSIALFLLAGLLEIGGGYLIWQWWRNGTHWGMGALGALTLILYGIARPISPLTSAVCTRLMEDGLWFSRSCGAGAWIISRRTAMISLGVPSV
jgi:hypothetical protein